MKTDKDERVPGLVRTYDFSLELLNMIKEYQHGNRLDSRIAAVRQMLAEAYDAWKLRINSGQG